MFLLSRIWLLIFAGAVIFAAYFTFRVARSMVIDVFTHNGPLPAWLEAAAPLKGRWLRLFLAAPWFALVLPLIFLTTLLCAVLAGALVPYLVGMGCEWIRNAPGLH